MIYFLSRYIKVIKIYFIADRYISEFLCIDTIFTRDNTIVCPNFKMFLAITLIRQLLEIESVSVVPVL